MVETTSLPQTYNLRVSTDFCQLNQVYTWFSQFKRIPHKIWMQCNLVLIEGLTNVIRHAHEFLPTDTPIDIEVTLLEGALELRIWDFGKPFDLKAELDRLSQQKFNPLDIDSIPTSGRGLAIANTVSDYFSYDRTTDGRNCFLIRKNY
jgi:serine/threonine-protein kinase RsbW